VQRTLMSAALELDFDLQLDTLRLRLSSSAGQEWGRLSLNPTMAKKTAGL